MRVLLGIEFVVGVLAYAVCIVDDLARRRWRTPVGRQLLVASAALLAEWLSLLAVMLGVPLSPWVFVVGFGLAAAVAVSWVWLRWRARHDVA